jgi:hypothetical protein
MRVTLRARVVLLALLLALVGAGLGGCAADEPFNPSFDVTVDDARDALRAMRDDPRPYERPIVVIGGIFDPGMMAPAIARELRRLGADAEVASVTFMFDGSFDACRRRTIATVERAWPSDDPSETVEVDVVAISMGGLVARHAARPPPDPEAGRRLRVRRLYTISTPHRGARMAGVPTLDERIRDMRPGSEFLAALDEPQPLDPVLVPYARLDDAIVGPENAAPPGMDPWWVPNIPLAFSHLLAAQDPRIIADIARRLRGETPYSRAPAAPLPGPAGDAAGGPETVATP